MGGNKVSYNLKRIREKERITVKEVQEELLRRGVTVSNKTIYGWESGHRMPDADVFLILCDIYGVNSVAEEFKYGADNYVDAAHEDMGSTAEEREIGDAMMKDDSKWE